MFGLVSSEILVESFNEPKQTSGYGVVLHTDFMEDECWEYFIEEEEEEELRAHVLDKLIAERSKQSFRILEEAIKV